MEKEIEKSMEGNLWKRNVLRLKWKTEGVVDGESGEDKTDMIKKVMNKEETNEVVTKMSGSWFQRRGDACIEDSDQWFVE